MTATESQLGKNSIQCGLALILLRYMIMPHVFIAAVSENFFIDPHRLIVISFSGDRFGTITTTGTTWRA